jgi:diguanylate cyclase (GGDEF)-like protein
MKGADGKRRLANATATLASLESQAQALREELVKLRGDLGQVQLELRQSRDSELQEANEKLVLAVLRADSIAEAAAGNLSLLARESQRDALTALPNRVLMRERLEAAIAVANLHGTQFALIFVDLDDFKWINDTLGHALGDQALQLVAQRLDAAVRSTDTVSRHGGDEFLVLLPEPTQAADAAVLASKLVEAVAVPAQFGSHVLHLAASLGIALYPQDGADVASLIHAADAAMYRSKHDGQGGFAFSGHGPRKPASARSGKRRTVAARPLAGTAAGDADDMRLANERLVIAALGAQQAAVDASEAHRQQIRFMAMVAHELRNPLTPIRVAADLMVGGHAPAGAAFVRLNTIILAQVTHMSRLIDDLLEGARIGAGKLRLDRGEVDMLDALALAVGTCLPMMETRRQLLVQDLPPGPQSLHGDRVRLAQVFINLLDNASKYTPHEGTITLSMESRGADMQITVADTGIGIGAKMLPKIFDMFVQDAQNHALSGGGLGIGLAVVRELVQAHGGTVVATSAGKHHGSRFVVRLPCTEPPPATASA